MSRVALTVEVLQRLSPLGSLGSSGLQQALGLARQEFLPRSRTPAGFPLAHKVAYLLKGELKLGLRGGAVKVLVGGHGDALLPLGRHGTVVDHLSAITDADLLWFDENALDILVTWDQAVPAATPDVASADWRAMSGIFDMRLLTLGAFAHLPVAHIESLLRCFRRKRVVAGEVVVRQGEPGDGYYVIERGRALVTREVGGAAVELADLDAGDAFGEEALVSGALRNATVTMRTDGHLLRLEAADFIRLLREPLLQSIPPEQAWQAVADGAQWVDVRFPAEFRCDGLPGALNIPLNELRDALPGLQRDKEYIVYCKTGRRSAAADFLLSQHGFRSRLLAGGLRSMPLPEREAA